MYILGRVLDRDIAAVVGCSRLSSTERSLIDVDVPKCLVLHGPRTICVPRIHSANAKLRPTLQKQLI